MFVMTTFGTANVFFRMIIGKQYSEITERKLPTLESKNPFEISISKGFASKEVKLAICLQHFWRYEWYVERQYPRSGQSESDPRK